MEKQIKHDGARLRVYYFKVESFEEGLPAFGFELEPSTVGGGDRVRLD